jgi:hypothetical protein
MAAETLWERTRDFLSLPLTPLGTPGVRQRVIARAMGFPLDSIVERFRLEQGLTELHAQSLERELKRYLAICAICSNQWVPMEGPVDDLWVLFFADHDLYDDFCSLVAGALISRDIEMKIRSRRRRLADARRFARLYRRVFGEGAPEAYWPAVAMLNQYRRGANMSEIDFERYVPASRGYADHAAAGSGG